MAKYATGLVLSAGELLGLKACPSCGAENLDVNSRCGVCGASFEEAKRSPPSKVRIFLLHYATGPVWALFGLVWFWISGSFLGIGLLMVGLLLILASVGSDREAAPYGWRFLWYRLGYKEGTKMAEDLSHRDENEKSSDQS